MKRLASTFRTADLIATMASKVSEIELKFDDLEISIMPTSIVSCIGITAAASVCILTRMASCHITVQFESDACASSIACAFLLNTIVTPRTDFTVSSNSYTGFSDAG